MASEEMILLDRYQLLSELGRGGMGIVYRAHDTVLRRDVAIKLLTGTGLGTEGRARMLREAQSAAALNHPNLVAVFDAGEAELGPGKGHTPFVIMELVQGRNLHELPSLDLGQVLAITRQLCQALDHAHSHGIIHRDLKPENVLLAEDGTTKLVDFGLARSASSRLTTEGAITGTLAYMAPELALGKEFDQRVDLYSLGVMLYELTTGQLPFTADDPVAIITQHLYAPLVPPRAHYPELPAQWEALIVKLMSKKPADRPFSAAEVLAVLDRLDREEEISAPAEDLSLLDRIVRGRLVGREYELAEARALWQRAVQGEGQMLLISGEPGIGKTRLTREIVTQVEVTGGDALVGESYPGSGAPYAPFSQIVLNAFQDGRSATADLPSFVLADLLKLAPSLQLHYQDIPPNSPLEPEAEQQRLFENVVAFSRALSAQQPLLVILEDVHWADSGSLALMHHLARRTRHLPLMIIATYREVELDETLPFNQLLMELNRERLASRIKLTRLDRQQTQTLLSVLFSEEVTVDFLDGIYRETEGNPFFIEEVCKSLVESGQLLHRDGAWQRPSMAEMAIPQSVRVAIQSRVSKFPGEYQEVFNLAAILGREFDFDTLAAASDLDEDTLIDALEAAERAQLIEEVSERGGATFSFAHALIPTTLAESMSTLRRKRLHRSAARAIESLHPGDFESLAYHYCESGDLDAGLDYLMKAGERALDLSAHGEARRHYGRALEIAESDRNKDTLLKIYMALGKVEDVADFNLALEYYDLALAHTQNLVQQAIIKVKIGRLKVVMGDESGLPLLEDAVDILKPETHGNEVAQAIAAIGRFHHNRGHHRLAIERLEEARRIAEPHNDVATLLYVYTFLAGAYQHLANFERSSEWAEKEIELGRETNYTFMEAVGNEYLAENHSFMGKWEKALDYAEQDKKLGEESGLLERVRWAGLAKLWALHNLGQFEPALEEGVLSLEQAEANGDWRLAVLAGADLARVYADTDALDRATELAETAILRAMDLDQAYMICEAQDARAYIHHLRGEWIQALEKHLAIVDFAKSSDNRLIPMINNPGLAEALLEIGRADEAAKFIGEALAITQESNSLIPEARSLRVLGRIQATRNDVEEASKTFAQAAKLCEEWDSQMLLGRILLDWGSLQVDHESAKTAASTLKRAQAIFETAGANYWVERTRTTLENITDPKG